MKTVTLTLAALAALTFAAPLTTVAQAQDRTVIIKHRGDNDRGLHRGWVRGHHYGWNRHRANKKVVVIRSHRRHHND